MFKNVIWRQGAVIALVTTLALAMFSVTSAFAAGSPPTTTATTQAATQSLEANWKVDLTRFQFDSTILARVDRLLDRIGSRSEKVDITHEQIGQKEKSPSVIDGDILLAKAQAIISSHAGLDATGKVTDQTQALKSMDQLGAILNQFRDELLFKLRGLLLHS